MFGFKKKEKEVSVKESRATEIMDAVGVEPRLRKGLFNHNKAFQHLAEELFDDEVGLKYMFASNPDFDGVGAIVLLTSYDRLVVRIETPFIPTIEIIPLKRITSVQSTKYELLIQAGIKDYHYKLALGDPMAKEMVREIKYRIA